MLPEVNDGVPAPLPIDTPGARTLAKPFAAPKDGMPVPLPIETPLRKC